MERGARTSGSRFAYLKGDLVFLQFALVQFALQKLASKGFRPVIVPVLVRDEAMYGTGFFPTDMQQVYRVEADGLNLVGTSEVPLAALHMDEILDEADLPGALRGLLQLLPAGSRGGRQGHAGHLPRAPVRQGGDVQLLRARQVRARSTTSCAPSRRSSCRSSVCPTARSTSPPATWAPRPPRSTTCEAWLPTQERYREVTSCSNCTDYQARRLKVRAKGEKGSPYLLHTLNGTVVALGRTMIAIMENYQTEDGTHRGAGGAAAVPARRQGDPRRMSGRRA